MYCRYMFLQMYEQCCNAVETWQQVKKVTDEFDFFFASLFSNMVKPKKEKNQHFCRSRLSRDLDGDLPAVCSNENERIHSSPVCSSENDFFLRFGGNWRDFLKNITWISFFFFSASEISFFFLSHLIFCVVPSYTNILIYTYQQRYLICI